MSRRKCEDCKVDMTLIRSQDPKARKRLRCPRCGKQKGLTPSMGRPPLPDDQVKKNRCLRLNDQVWERLGEIGNGVHAAGIENLIKFFERHSQE